MSELAFELRFVIDITELSIYLCLVLGSQNHSEIRQQTRFWRGNSQWQIARCKMPFQRWPLDEMKLVKKEVMNGIQQWFWFEATRGFDTFPYHVHSTSEDTKTNMEMLIDAIQVQTDVEAAGVVHVMTLSWFMRSPWVLPPDKASPNLSSLQSGAP